LPTLEQNQELWTDETTWSCAGDDWSRSWGGAAAQWHGSVLPRIRLRCIGQELVNWGTRRVLLDCFSSVVRANSPRVRDRRVARNPCFMSEAESIRRASRLLTP